MMLFATTLKALPVEFPVKVPGPVSLGRDPFRRAELVFTPSAASAKPVLKIANIEVSKRTLTGCDVQSFWDTMVLPIPNEKPKLLYEGTFDKTMWCDGKPSYELI